MEPQILNLSVALLCAGALAGFTAGMFGIGGGAVMVPALYHAFTLLGYHSETIMHMSIATSVAVIIVTALRSACDHHKKDAVDWNLVWPGPFFQTVPENWGFWVAAGSLSGAVWLSSLLSGAQLTLLFGIIMVGVAMQFIFGNPDWRLAKEIPGPPAAPLAGTGLGALCALMGIGFGSVGVTLMLLCGRKIHTAIGTAAAIGFFIGLPAAIGYIISGWSVSGRPPLSLGYVNLVGFVVMIVMTIICVPFGVKLAHKLDQKILRTIFGVCLLLVSLNMIRKIAL
ncbi:MAG: sulfite exporter TauE/SafE family protein [Hyphomonadaceae bacterium]|nr:sulfite exporter TauE/SafE family protein [Hyphomonadaceae bacterium]MBC6411474.1 sulfite exporter TauE/SafE family protein [Hyphomonadaceae bacterium]